MIIIERYLRDLQQVDDFLFEQTRPAPLEDDPDRERLDQTPEKFKGVPRGPGAFLNAPIIAWELTNDRTFPGWRPGHRPGTKTRSWKGFIVDFVLRDKWLEDLNDIPNVQMRSLCSGHGPAGKMGDSPTSIDWPTHVAFRLTGKVKNSPGAIIRSLEKDKFTKCRHGKGREGKTRFVCAAPLYYRCAKHTQWIKWWDTLASRINKAVNG
jgi:hypothetical protein